MLFMHRGGFSGINAALMRAWREGCPEVVVTDVDVHDRLFGGITGKLRALPRVVRRGGPAVLWKRGGHFEERLKELPWYWDELSAFVDRLQRESDWDFSLSTGTILPVEHPPRPHFIYTDHTILANRYYPGGEAFVAAREHLLPQERRTLERASGVFTMSRHVSRSLVEHYGLAPEKVQCVRAGCNTPPIGRGEPGRFERRNILFIGVDWERKGGPELVQAFRQVRVRHPRATLTIVGCRPALQEPGVEVVGPVPQSRIPGYLARASLFCMPSWREPFGIVYLEAMQAGLPVLAWNLGAVPDMVREGQTGHMVEPGDVDGLARRMGELMDQPEKCRAMGSRGRDIVDSSFKWQATQRAMWGAIRGVLGETSVRQAKADVPARIG